MTSIAAQYELNPPDYKPAPDCESATDCDSAPPQVVARSSLPWLMSMTSHMVLVLSLALMFKAEPPPRGVVNGDISVTVVGDGGPASGGGGGSNGDADVDDNLDSSAAMSSEQPLETVETVPIHTGGELASLLDDVPPVELAGVMPPAGSVLGSATAAASTRTTTGFSVEESIGRSARGSGGGSGGGAGTGNGPRNGSGSGNGVTAALKNGQGRTGVFGLVGDGYKFIYVFDRSGSMDGHGGSPLAAAKRELIHSIERLDQTHQFQIIFYNEQPRAFGGPTGDGRLVFGSQQNKRLAERFINGIIADGATQHEGALALALRLNPDVIFFLTDADEPTLSPKQLDRIRRMNNGTSINTIEFGYGPQQDGGNFLVRLAHQNGGNHVYVDISELPVP